jgi:hypothetical protein
LANRLYEPTKTGPEWGPFFVEAMHISYGLFHAMHQLVDRRCEQQVSNTKAQTDPEQ